MKYVIWNRFKVECYREDGLSDYDSMIDLEKSTGYTYSSVVHTDNIDQLIEAIYNETDIDLSFKEIEQ